MDIVSQVVITVITQCPVLGGLIWFLIMHTKETNQRFSEQAKQYESALNKVVDGIVVRLDKIDDKIDDLKIDFKTNNH